MVNHPNRIGSKDVLWSRRVAQGIMNKTSGRAKLRIGGETLQWNSLSMKSALFVGDCSIPVDELREFITEDEAQALEDLPIWDGSNEYQMNMTCLGIVSRAIKRRILTQELKATRADLVEALDDEDRQKINLCRNAIQRLEIGHAEAWETSRADAA